MTTTTIGEVIREWIEDLKRGPQRHPIVRSGERDQIAWLVRLSIYERDGHLCRRCKSPNDLELDHIVPWSAGGPDLTTNLRTFCHACNTSRSNYRDKAWEERGIWPTTWWCWHCWRHPEIEIDDPDLSEWDEPRHRFHTVWKDGTNLAAAPYVTKPETHVYCASCQTFSYSNVILAGAMQQELVALCAPREPFAPPVTGTDA